MALPEGGGTHRGLAWFLYITLLLDVPEKASGHPSQGVEAFAKVVADACSVTRGRNQKTEVWRRKTPEAHVGKLGAKQELQSTGQGGGKRVGGWCPREEQIKQSERLRCQRQDLFPPSADLRAQQEKHWCGWRRGDAPAETVAAADSRSWRPGLASSLRKTPGVP